MRNTKRKTSITILLIGIILIIVGSIFYLNDYKRTPQNYFESIQISSTNNMHDGDNTIIRNDFVKLSSDKVINLEAEDNSNFTLTVEIVFDDELVNNDYQMQLKAYDSNNLITESSKQKIISKKTTSELFVNPYLSYIDLLIYDGNKLINTQKYVFTVSNIVFNFNEAIKDANLRKCILDVYKDKTSFTRKDLLEIEVLNCDNRKISNLNGLSYLSNLKVLYLNENDVDDITEIKHLKKLVIFGMNSNMIKDLTPLKENTELEIISLQNNLITDVSPLKELKKLKDLPDLYNNNVINLDILEDNLKLYYNNYINNHYDYKIENEKFIIYTYDYSNSSISGCDDDYITCQAKDSYESSIKEMNQYKEAIKIARDFIKEKIKENMSDIEKEAIISKYIMDKMTYYEGDYKTFSNSFSDDRYPPFVLNTGVCHHYAVMFNTLATMAGLESYYVTGGNIDSFSGDTGHAWNIVKIDGKYYHIDLTWEDADGYGTFINISTKKMNELHMSYDFNELHRSFKLDEDMNREIVKKYFVN